MAEDNNKRATVAKPEIKTDEPKDGTLVRFIKKSNELVEARYKFDIWETRLFTRMLMMIDRDDKDFHEYRVYLTDLIKDFGLDRSNASYERLKMGAMKLMTKIIQVVRETKDGPMEFSTPIVVGVDNPLNPEPGDGEFIDMSFHPKMKPFLLELREKFTMYDVRNILKLPSSYSIRIYELLKQYEKIGRRKFEINELKQIIGAIEERTVRGKKEENDHYPLYGNFRQRVLLKAQKDLREYTDISFTFEPVKKGRKYKWIVFNIKSNTPKKKFGEPEPKQMQLPLDITPETTEEINEELLDDLYQLVEEWGISREKLEDWVAEHGGDQVKQAVFYTRQRDAKGEIKHNPGGYLARMVKEKDLNIAMPKPTDEEKKARERAAELEQKIRELRDELENLKREKYEKEQAVILNILEKNPLIAEEIFGQVKEMPGMEFDEEQEDMEIYHSNPAVRFKVDKIIRKKYGKKFKKIDETYDPRIAALKKKAY
jgi:plasmid replication initiation protein